MRELYPEWWRSAPRGTTASMAVVREETAVMLGAGSR
jgi:hypothetical protein